MAKTIVIPEPAPFYSPHDEDVFFEWLYTLPGFIQVVRELDGLHLTVKSFNKNIILELIAAMTRYNLDMRCLATLCNSKTLHCK